MCVWRMPVHASMSRGTCGEIKERLSGVGPLLLWVLRPKLRFSGLHSKGFSSHSACWRGGAHSAGSGASFNIFVSTPESSAEVFWCIKSQVWKTKLTFIAGAGGFRERLLSVSSQVVWAAQWVLGQPGQCKWTNQNLSYMPPGNFLFSFLFSFSLWYKWIKMTSVYNKILSSPRKCWTWYMRKVLFIGGSCTSGPCSVPLEEWVFHLIYKYYVLTTGNLESKAHERAAISATLVSWWWTLTPSGFHAFLRFGKFSCRQKDFFFHRVVFCGYLSDILRYSIIKRLWYLGCLLHDLLLLLSTCRWSPEMGEWLYTCCTVLQSPGETIRLRGFLQAKQRVTMSTQWDLSSS